MKKWILLFTLLFNGLLLFAQKNVIANPVFDSVKSKWGKVKALDGNTMMPSDDIIQNISQSKEYTVLFNAITSAGLTETFKSKGPITIFAPTNEAFGKLPAGELDTLLKPEHKLDLNYLLTYQAIAGRFSAKDIERKIISGNGQAVFTTISGGKLIAKIDNNRNIVLIDENGGESIISKFDIHQSNGMLHVVNSVLVPKSKSI